MKSEKYRKYANRIYYLTNCNLKLAGIVIENRRKYNVDHIFPIAKGFELDIPVELMSSLDNLQIMEYTLNNEKGSKITEIPSAILDYLVEHDIYI